MRKRHRLWWIFVIAGLAGGCQAPAETGQEGGGEAPGVSDPVPSRSLGDTLSLPSVRVSKPPEAPAYGFEAEAIAWVGEADPSRLLEQVRELWRAAADHEVPESALVELTRISFHARPEVAELARRAIDDLERLRAERSAAATADPTVSLQPAHLDAEADEPAWVPSPAVDRASTRRPAAALQQRIARVEQAPPAERLDAIQEVWRYAADTGLAAQAVAALAPWAAVESEPAVARRLRDAVDDLHRLSGTGAPENDGQSAMEGTVVERFEQTDDVADRAALLAVASGYGDADAAALAFRAAQDPAPSLRLEAVQTLWRMAADGRGDPLVLRSALESMAFDSDRGVRSTVQRAIEDLQALDSEALVR